MTNREWAAATLLGLALAAVLSTRTGRQSLASLTRILFGRLLVAIGLYVAYLALAVGSRPVLGSGTTASCEKLSFG